MRPLTDHTPKPLLQAGGKPLIVWHIERLVQAGITDLIVNHAHLGEKIERELGSGIQFGAHIRYSAEGSALETAGGIAFALDLLGDEPFIVINGDVYCDYNIAQVSAKSDQLKNKQDNAHLVLVNNPSHHPNGDFLLSEGRVLQTENQRQMTIGSQLTFSGIGLYQPTLFAHILRGSKTPLAPLLREHIALGKVSGEHYQGIWVDVGTPERLDQLDKNLRATQNAIHV